MAAGYILSSAGLSVRVHACACVCVRTVVCDGCRIHLFQQVPQCVCVALGRGGPKQFLNERPVTHRLKSDQRGNRAQQIKYTQKTHTFTTPYTLPSQTGAEIQYGTVQSKLIRMYQDNEPRHRHAARNNRTLHGLCI